MISYYKLYEDIVGWIVVIGIIMSMGQRASYAEDDRRLAMKWLYALHFIALLTNHL